MDYNTQLPKLKLPEYGRNIQKMIDHAISLEDREERTKAAHTIIKVMGNMNPSLRENRDFKHKLWDHLHMMAEFKLEIDSPFDPPSPDQFQTRPARVPYPKQKIKFQHYGKIVEQMIDQAIQMEDDKKRMEYGRLIANHMKLSYLSWNKDSVNDALILNSLKELSGGLLDLPPGTELMEFKEPVIKPTNTKKKRHKGNKSKQ